MSVLLISKKTPDGQKQDAIQHERPQVAVAVGPGITHSPLLRHEVGCRTTWDLLPFRGLVGHSVGLGFYGSRVSRDALIRASLLSCQTISNVRPRVKSAKTCKRVPLVSCLGTSNSVEQGILSEGAVRSCGAPSCYSRGVRFQNSSQSIIERPRPSSAAG